MRRIVKYTAVTLAMAGVALFIVFFGLQLRKGPQGPARDIPSDWAIHQYSERGKVEGWPMNVDLDYKERTYTEITNHNDTLKL